MPWRGPEYPGELPTLGWYALDWIADNLIVPDGPTSGDPLTLTPEQAQFVLDFYTINPRFDGRAVVGRALVNGRRVRRALLSRPKGWGKSPLLAALSLFEALGDVVPDGWDEDGEPIGRPWSSLGFKVNVQIVAVSEDQTGNTWEPLLAMARGGPVLDNYAIEPLETFVNVPRGRIEYVTSSADSREGFRPVFAVMDQTESWRKTNGGLTLAATIRRNIAKVNGATLETPNAFIPGEGSVAQKSYEAWQLQQARKSQSSAGGILLDHREAPPETDPEDRASMLKGLAVAYGDSADVNGGWVTLERILEDFWDPAVERQDARRFFLNQITHAIDSWLAGPEWRACKAISPTAPPLVIASTDAITLGFDGSRKRTHSVTDATALIGCRVSDGHLFEIAVWQPDKGQEVDTALVDATVRDTFRRFNVVGMYADPAKWESFVAAWEADLGGKLKLKATREHPITWWMTGGRSTLIVRATAAFEQAVLARELSHDGTPTLTAHVLNARRRTTAQGTQIAKEHPESPNKIDAAVAGILAYQARLDALGAGIGNRKKPKAPKRIR